MVGIRVFGRASTTNKKSSRLAQFGKTCFRASGVCAALAVLASATGLNAQSVSFSPTSLSWGSVAVGNTSGAKTLTLTNNQTMALNISSIAFGPDFVKTATTCSGPVAAGGSCTVSIAFRPLSTGAISEAVTFSDDAPTSPQSVPLTAKGVAGSVLFSPTSLTFAGVPAGTVSPSQTATLTNETSAALGLTSITVSGHFAQTNNCPSSLAAGANCTVTVTSNPIANVNFTGSVNAKDSTGNLTLLYLSGAGGSVTLSPSTYTFPNQTAGTSSTPAAFTLTNSESAPVSISNIAVSNSVFTESDNCNGSVGAGSHCTISITFTPQTTGTQTATLTVTDNGGGGTQTASISGTGVSAPGISFSPSSLTWGNVAVGGTSSTQTVTLTNNQTVALNISSIAVGSDFQETATTCPNAPTSVAAGGNCTVTVAFRPQSTGAKSEAVIFTDDAAGSPQSVPLAGSGVVGSGLFSPTALTFAAVPAGTVSPSQTATFTNETSAALGLTTISVTGNFAQTNTCPSSLAVGANCTFTVTSNPTANGSFSGSVNVIDSTGSTTMLFLSGAGGSVTLSPSTYTFPNQIVGTSSTPAAFTLTNSESATLTISNIAVSNSVFTESDNCNGSVAAGSNCTISITFTPQSTGTQTATLTVTDNAGGGTQTASITGTGVSASGIAFSPGSLAWGSEAVGGTASTKTVTLTNNQTVALNISSIAVGPDFQETATTCPIAPTSVAPGGNCAVTVAFRPQSTGAKSEAVIFTDDAASSPQSVPLTGTGVIGSGLFSPTSLTFAAVPAGTVSPSKTATFTNETSAALGLTTISVSGHFAQTNNCASSLAVGANCTFTVTSNPTANGNTSGSVNVIDSTGNTTMLFLSGAGGNVTLTPSSFTFPNQVAGTSSTPAAFTLTNNESGAVTISSIATSNPVFTESDNCNGSVAAGSNCTISITFTPQSAGTQTATLSVTDNVSGSPQTASITGTGTTSGTSNVTLTPASYNFPNQAAGTVGSPVPFTLTNGQSGTLSISSISISSTAFSQTNNCGSSVAAGASCTISVEFTPQNNNAQSATLSVSDNANGSPQTASLTGNTTAAPVKVNPGNLAYGPQIIGRPSNPQSVTVSNTTSSPVTINSINSTGSPFSVTNSCITNGSNSGTLAGGASCSISVIFDPTVSGPSNGSITITTSSPSGAVSIPLAGTGEVGDTAPAMLVTPQTSCVLPSATQQFASQTKNIANPGTVTWYVNGVKNGNSTAGTITAGGLYTAPTGTGTFTVQAVDSTDSLSASTTIAVTTSPTFVIYPYTSSIPPGGQQTFQGQICNVPDANATFTVDNIAGGNATVGTITNNGVYTAPKTAGKHIVRVTDSTLNKTSGAVVTVFSSIAVDFGSRTNQKYPIRAGILGVNHVDGLHNPTDMGLIAQAGVTLSRTYANLQTVYATQTPDWTKIDPLISSLSKLGMHVLLQVAFSPPWLQPNPNPCGAGDFSVPPTNYTMWGQLAASYVAHMDANFPGVVTDYEIWNEPNAGNLCGANNSLNAYLAIYAAAAPLMKQQAAADGVSIRIGGPVSAGLDSTYINALLSNSSTAPYVDFMSYHNYMAGIPGTYAEWDTYNGNESLYDITQYAAGAAPGAAFTQAEKLVSAGKQPGGANTPVYVDEYNTNWDFAQDCCKNDPTYSPIWNALYVSDVLDQVYYSGTQAVPGQLAYYAANAYPYFCLVGTWDTNMDCQYTTNTTPVPYPQYYALQLMGSPDYLGMNSGGYMAASVSPAFAAGGIESTAFYTPTKDSILIVNPTATAYSNITVTITNSGFSSPSANVYQVVNGQSIGSSSITLTPAGSGAYTVNISIPAYTVTGIAIQGP